MQTQINGRQYQVQQLTTGARATADLQARGWDGHHYILTGKRGATYLALRSAKTGQFNIV